MTYYANINPELLAWMPLDATEVLELGCGTGALAAAYRERNPNARYTAVEMHGPAAEEALGKVDRLFVGDFEAMSDADICDGRRFDLIVLGDVLEHLVGAEVVLRRLGTMLAAGGHLVISVPNIGHWTAFYHLFHGGWPRHDSGLFDRTHVRFFTLDALREMLAASGFRPLKIRSRDFPLDRAAADRWMPSLADFAASMGIDRDAFVRRASALQYVVVAVRAQEPPLSRMLLEISAYAPQVMDVRTRLPAEFLQSEPTLVVHYHERELRLPPASPDTPKIVVIQRLGRPDPDKWLDFLAAALRQEWLTITEFDDHPDLASRVKGWDLDDPRRTIPFEQVHAIQTSTAPLAALFRQSNPEVAAFENAAFVRPPFIATRDGPPTIFYGALNRGDFAIRLAQSLAPAIAAVPELAFEVVHDRAFFDALPTAQKGFQEVLPYDDYSALLRRCGIALLPLAGAPEELFKSDLKYVEAAAASAAVVASPAVYSATVRDGETGIIAPTLADWAPALIDLATNPGKRCAIARAAWEHVGAERMFASQVAQRMAWYRDLWARRAELNESLVTRTPGLAERLAT